MDSTLSRAMDDVDGAQPESADDLRPEESAVLALLRQRLERDSNAA
jgi:hypothetical protein